LYSTLADGFRLQRLWASPCSADTVVLLALRVFWTCEDFRPRAARCAESTIPVAFGAPSQVAGDQGTSWTRRMLAGLLQKL